MMVGQEEGRALLSLALPREARFGGLFSRPSDDADKSQFRASTGCVPTCAALVARGACISPSVYRFSSVLMWV